MKLENFKNDKHSLSNTEKKNINGAYELPWHFSGYEESTAVGQECHSDFVQTDFCIEI